MLRPHEQNSSCRSAIDIERRIPCCNPLDLEHIFAEFAQHLDTYFLPATKQINGLKLISWVLDQRPELDSQDISSLIIRAICLYQSLAALHSTRATSFQLETTCLPRWLFDFAAIAWIDETSVASLSDAEHHETHFLPPSLCGRLFLSVDLTSDDRVPELSLTPDGRS